MKYSLLQSSALLALSTVVVEGRLWEDVIDKAIYQQSGVNVARMQLQVEWDPFLAEAGPHSHPNTILLPTSAPTVAPCHEGTEYYQVNMYDSSGNGWNSTKIQVIGIEDQDIEDLSKTKKNKKTHKKSTNKGNGLVSISNTVEFREGSILNDDPRYAFPLGKIFEGELTRGSSDYADICLLPKRCYEIVVSGGALLEEVSWDITLMQDFKQASTPYISGKAPMYCKFSIPDENGEVFCPADCTETLPDKFLTMQKPITGGNPTLWDIIHPVPSDDASNEKPTNLFQSLFETFFTPRTAAPTSTPDPEEGEGVEEFANLLDSSLSNNGGMGHEEPQAPTAPTPAPSIVGEQGQLFDVNNGDVLVANGLTMNTLIDIHEGERK
jgi:hypothetical protein